MVNGYNLAYDYVAILLSIVLLCVFAKTRKTGINIYNVYYELLVVIMVCAIFDIGSIHVIGYEQKLGAGAVNLVNMVYLMMINSMPFLFLRIVLSMAGIDYKQQKIWRRHLVIPWAILGMCLMTSPMTKLFFYADENAVYRHGVLFNGLFAFPLYVAIAMVIICVQYYKVIGKKQIIYLCICFMLAMVGEFLQTVVPTLMLVCFAVDLVVCIVMYLTRSVDEIFEASGAMYGSHLYECAMADYRAGQEFDLIIVRFRDLALLEKSFGEENQSLLMRSVVAYFNSIYNGARTYKMDENTYAIRYVRVFENEKDKLDLLDQVLIRMEAPFKGGDMEVVLPASVMQLHLPSDARDFESFKKLLDAISFAENPKNNEWFLSELQEEEKKAAILAAVKNAVENNGFQVFYQPIYSTDQKQIVAAEALIRLIDPELGFISPEIFIPMAEKAGYILSIGKFVFTEVCRFFSENNLKEKGIRYIEVNLSPIQCMQYQMAEEFMDIMKEYSITETQINFEITETAAMTTNQEVSANINSLVRYGIDLSLDDYGTGFSNLSYLAKLPFHYLKVDKSLLWSADTNEKADVILHNTIQMAKKLDMMIIVEGVETIEQVKKLLALKADFFQGYYFSKPVNGTLFLEYLDKFEVPAEMQEFNQ